MCHGRFGCAASVTGGASPGPPRRSGGRSRGTERRDAPAAATHRAGATHWAAATAPKASETWVAGADLPRRLRPAEPSQAQATPFRAVVGFRIVHPGPAALLHFGSSKKSAVVTRGPDPPSQEARRGPAGLPARSPFAGPPPRRRAVWRRSVR